MFNLVFYLMILYDFFKMYFYLLQKVIHNKRLQNMFSVTWSR